MKYLVIGLGVYGTNIARDLTDIGHEVIAVDQRPDAVEKIKDVVATTYILDTSDENSISLLPLANIDIAIVTIGNNFGGSIRTVALLKKGGMKRIMVRAMDELQESILEGMGVERILTPEKKAAFNFVNELALDSKVESMSVSDGYYIFKISAPKDLVGKHFSTLLNGNFYNMKFIGAARPVDKSNLIGLKTKSYRLLGTDSLEGEICENDILTFFSSLKDFRTFDKDLSED